MKKEKNLSDKEVIESLTEFSEQLLSEIHAFPKEEIDFLQKLFKEEGEARDRNKTGFLSLHVKTLQGKATADEIKQVNAVRKKIKDFDYKINRLWNYFEVKIMFMAYTKGYKIEDAFNAVANDLPLNKMRKDNKGIPN
ncbi:MAG: hypothetical protein HY063_03460 [Bacteroidetes bacterium]|nr:hypothetical protein [Bacteroidota bacterium]